MKTILVKSSNKVIHDNDESNLCQTLKLSFTHSIKTYYNNMMEWNLHQNGRVEKITLLNFDILHLALGCKMLHQLASICPRAIIIPMATLLSNCSVNVIFDDATECLYRTDDAVGLIISTSKIYLVPVKSEFDHLHGFDIVTKKRSLNT